MLYAEDGQDALDKAKTYDVDLVFMDLQMPRMDGYEATQNLRARGFKRPIIAVTASEQPDEHEQCFKVGIDDILIKPFKQVDIGKMLQKWLDELHVSVADSTESAPAAEGNFDPDGSRQKVPAQENEVFDAKLILDNFSNDNEAAISILSIFLRRTEDQIENFPILEKTGDWDSARRDAHSIKGSAGNLGGAKLKEAAARLENACISNSKDEFKTTYPQLCEAFRLFKGKAEEFTNSRS